MKFEKYKLKKDFVEATFLIEDYPIDTFAGQKTIKIGNWLIKENNSLYPLSDEKFKELYKL